MSENCLTADGVYFSVPQLDILQGVYLKVRAGTVAVLVGRNGCGKSTLLKVMAGQIQCESGISEINGQRFHKKATRHRFEHIAYLPQDSMLPSKMRVHKLLRIFGSPERPMKDDIINRVQNNRVEELSGGERRYLEISLLMSLKRPYLLLDEPFTGVEPLLIDRISRQIKQFAASGAGILVTDHYHHYTLPIADDVYLMMNKQCRQLAPETDYQEQLADAGYIRAKSPLSE